MQPWILQIVDLDLVVPDETGTPEDPETPVPHDREQPRAVTASALEGPEGLVGAEKNFLRGVPSHFVVADASVAP